MKLVVVINGAGGVGKDTLCEFAQVKYKVMNISSVDLIKKAAKILGWDGKKENIDRKFLSDLKKLSKEYNDNPTEYLVQQYKVFLESNNEILFFHIREAEEIDHLKEKISGKIITVLIRRKEVEQQFGNSSDDKVEMYGYDYIYENNLPIDKASEDFIAFLERIESEQ